MTRKNKSMFVTAAIAAAGLASSANATILMSEPFPYADGALETVSGGLWEINSGTGSKFVSSSKLVIDDVNTSDYMRQYDAAQTVSAGTIYACFTVNVASADPPNTAGTYFAAFAGPKTAPSTFSILFRSRIGTFATAAQVSAGKFTLGISSDGATASSFSAWGTALDFNTTYTVVHSYNFATAVSTLWVNPTDETSTNVTNTGATGAGPMGSYLWRVSSSVIDGDKTVDDLDVATSFGELACIPEPSTAALFAAGGVAAMLRRRKKA